MLTDLAVDHRNLPPHPCLSLCFPNLGGGITFAFLLNDFPVSWFLCAVSYTVCPHLTLSQPTVSFWYTIGKNSLGFSFAFSKQKGQYFAVSHKFVFLTRVFKICLPKTCRLCLKLPVICGQRVGVFSRSVGDLKPCLCHKPRS